MLLPTAPTHYTIAAMDADPVALNRNLGAYTNFVNLLDYAAISVPSSLNPLNIIGLLDCEQFGTHCAYINDHNKREF